MKARKLLSFVVSLLLLLTMLPLGAVSVSAATVNDLTYEIADGAVTITDCNTSASGVLTIPSTIEGYPVTAIGENAFSWCGSLTSVTIGNGVTTIGDLAFNSCDSLTTVTIPDSVTTIGLGAFANCRSLTSITIPDSVTTIGIAAFFHCALTSITIPDSVTTIGNETFMDCYSLTSVSIPDSVTTIGEFAFQGCDSLTSIIIPDSVTAIGGNAFYDCRSLTTVTIPDSVTTIGYLAFAYCDSLTSIIIPNSVTTIGLGAFDDCTSLTDVYYDGTEEDRAAISIYSDNDPLLNATWHYHEHTYDDEHDADCNECGTIRCIHEYFSTCDIVCLICNEVGREVSHNIVHVPAVANTCYEEGHIEYWYCTECGYAWLDEDCTLNTNLLSVILPAAHSDDPSYDPYDSCHHNYRCTICGEVVLFHNIQHVPAVAPTHFTEGNVEYWYCAICWTYFLNEDCTEMVEYGSTIILPASHDIVHVEAKAPTCTELGNIEHWYCTECGYAWLDEECTRNTNLKAVILPMAEHTYDHTYDIDCNECDSIRTMDNPITYNGNSVSEDVSGLAFRFDVPVVGMMMNRTTAIYDGATIDDCKLMTMGAIVTNGVETVDIPCVYLWELKPDSCSFAVRLIDIPADKYDVAITATPYVVLEIDGVTTTIYGEAYTASYNDATNE